MQNVVRSTVQQNALTRADVPVGQAAHAAELTVAQLRNWLNRGLVTLLFAEQREGAAWRRLAFGDIARIAIIGELVRAGLSVADAAGIVDGDLAAAIQRLATHRNTPARAVVARLATWTIVAVPAGDGDWGVAVSQGAYDMPDTTDLPMFVTVRPGQIVARVIDRLEGNGD